MHGCCPVSVLVVNVEVDSMGGVVEGRIGLANKTSPWRAAIEKVQAELRQEYDVREARKRELEYLEKGGDPLYFKIGKAASVSVQSASFTDQHPDQFVTRFCSEAKGSFGFTASPHGDSVESSGRPGAPPCEPNGAGNLLLFDAEHEFSEGGRNSSHPSKVNNVNSEQSSQMDVRHNVRDENSTSFSLSRKAYKRRNRSSPIKDLTRLSSPDVNPTCGSNGSSLPSRQGHRDVKRLVPDAEIHNVSPNCNSQPASPLDDAFCKTELADGQQGIELDVKSVESTKDLTRGVSLNVASDAIASENLLDEQVNQHTVSAAAKTPIQMDCNGTKATCAMQEMPAVIGCQSSLIATKVQNHFSCCQMNGFSIKKGDAMTGGAHSSSGSKVLDSESSCTLTSLHVEGNKDSEMCTKVGNMDLNGNYKDQTLVPMRPNIDGGNFVEEKKENEVTGSTTLVNEGSTCACQSQVENSFKTQPDEELIRSGPALNWKIKNHSIVEVIECIPTGSEPMRKTTDSLNDSPVPGNEISCNHRHQYHIDSKLSNLPDAGLLSMISNVPLEVETSRSDMNMKGEVDEDSILKEAEIIEAKRKRIMELSRVTSPANVHQKSHWDYVLEEMAWLANDFAQERIWKITVAAQTCHRVAFTRLLRSRGKGSSTDLNKVAHTLGKAVMDFWRSVEERSKEVEKENQMNGTHSVEAYAVRFLKYNSHAEMPLTPDRTSDSGVLDLSWEDNLTEDNLFYTIPLGAMETYRKSIESHMAQCERIRSSVEEEVETSAYDGAADFESQDVAYDGDEGEINMYDMSSSRFGQKRKHLTDAYGPRMNDIGPDLLPSHCIENKVWTQHSLLLAKQPGSLSIPTKRVRTASRRVISSFNAATSGFIQQPNKTDASSGDTNSFQDDQSMLRCGSFIPNHLKVESVGEFEKQLPFDSAEVSTKHKKKKAKHLNVAYEQRWQGDSSFQHEQRGHFKKRSEQLESNASSGLLDQSSIKKPKIIWQSQDNSLDNVTSIADSVPSPVATQISNISNRNKFVKMLGRRDRGRKSKVLKVPIGQLGSVSSWSHFEEQALVVLVHDLGPNWELVSDAINSALHFKCVFHKAKECKERYNILMGRTSGDGVDNAEDSGSSQPYPSTLPGIPKGSARQLFQRLQEPMEEDTLKSHFEKIIMIGQKQHYRKTQDPKQLQQPHSSHAVALSQSCPNNLNGGPVLTPLELCDVPVASPDILSLGHQGSHSSGLAIPGRSTGTPIVPSSGPPSALQGSPNMMLGNNNPSSPGHLNSSIRDARFLVPRSASLSVEEQQRMQQYNHLMISGRNIPQSNISSAGTLPGADPGVRILPGGNGMGMVGDINRIMPTARPGIQGIASSSMVDSGSMVSPGLAPAMHSGVGSGQGSSMLRPRPALSQDSPRQILVPDLQMPGSTQGVSHFGGLSPSFPNQTASPVSPYPLQHQSHGISPQHTQVVGPHHPHFQGATNQAYAIRLAKERQLQQRFQQQQQKQQFASSNSLVPPHVQSQPQLPISSPIHNSSQVLPQAASPSPPALMSNSMPQQKHPTPSQGVMRNAQASISGLANQTGKQRQKQQFSQANRQHPQQRQLPQAQQQVKVKGVGRGNMVKHPNIPIDPSVNGVSVNPVSNQCLDKGEPVVQLVQNQGLYTGSTPHPAQPRLYVSPYSSNPSVTQQKMYSGQAPSSSKPLHNSTLQSDKSNGHIRPVTPIGLSAAHYSVPSLAMAGSNQQPQLHQKLSSQNQPTLQMVVQPNCQVNSGPLNKSQVGDSDTHRHPNDRSAELDSVPTKP